MGDAIWDDANIKSILRDECYIGNCVFGKRKRYEVGNTRAKAVSRSEWIIVEDTHEMIISKDDFEKVQASFPMQIKKKQ